ncbi:MAG: translation initiation factor eIF-2B [Patescibacteria group bacterium]
MKKEGKFNQICKDIQSLKIQGAENIARQALEALLIKSDKVSVNKLVSLRPTEPALRNTIKYALTFETIEEGIKETLDLMNKARKKIIQIGAKKIQSGTTIFTHCHSSTVVDILIAAKKQGKRFKVFNTETRPTFQGRITARDLARNKIPVTMFIDSSADVALKKADIFLFGSDAITSEGNVINKIGNKMFCELANKYGIPCYTCTFSWKFDPKTLLGNIEKLESRNPKEVWDKPPKGVKISNIVFEEIEANLISGVISELGILNTETFVSEVKKKYPFLF